MAVSVSKRSPRWKGVPAKDWNDWRWQVRHRVTTLEELEAVIQLTDEERQGIAKVLKKYRMAITPYYASIMDPEDAACPIRMQAVPTFHESVPGRGDMHDPLAEDRDMVAPNLVHRYPDRALLIVTDQCSMYCRFCTRRRLVGAVDKPRPRSEMEAAFEYLERTPAVRDVIVSGGDALIMDDDRLESIVARLRAISHVEVIRLGTRTPAVCPMRVTPAVVKMLKNYQPIYVNTHFNHPKELTPEAVRACALFVDGGIPVANQAVLLRHVNSSGVIIKNLVHGLMKIRVRPYYLFQCDLSEGIEHFRTPISKGIEIMEMLRGHTSGMAVPTFVVDLPGGGGKVPVFPQYVITQNEDRLILRNYRGYFAVYKAPEDTNCDCSTENEVARRPHAVSYEGLARLFRGDKISIEPKE
ncbi:MAG: lysine 2,3-aminomutase [Deltaproteobacteria bacterium]|nr:lysine 2,3-aminomutase [Deltaproteobacteria bacterium]